jgi:hypothetical protein
MTPARGEGRLAGERTTVLGQAASLLSRARLLTPALPRMAPFIRKSARTASRRTKTVPGNGAGDSGRLSVAGHRKAPRARLTLSDSEYLQSRVHVSRSRRRAACDWSEPTARDGFLESQREEEGQEASSTQTSTLKAPPPVARIVRVLPSV